MRVCACDDRTSTSKYFSLVFFPSSPSSLNNIPVSGLLLDHRVSGALLASGVADKKDKEQMVVFVIPSSFQPPGKPLPPLPLSFSPSLCTTAAFGGCLNGPILCDVSSLVGMDLHKQMVRLFAAINSLRESVGACLRQRFGGVLGWMWSMTFFLKSPSKRKKEVLMGRVGGSLQQEGQKSAGKVWEYFLMKRISSIHL